MAHRLAVAFFFALALPVSAQAPPSGATGKPADQPTLSEKLSETGGVIAPPATGDTEMTQKPPDNPVRTPVIPPGALPQPDAPPNAPPPEPK